MILVLMKRMSYLLFGLVLLGTCGMILTSVASATVYSNNGASRGVLFVRGTNETIGSTYKADLVHSNPCGATGTLSSTGLSLMTRTGLSTKDTVWQTLTVAVHPASNLTLRYNSTNPELYIRIYATSGSSVGTVLCNLTGINATNYQRNVSFNGNGLYQIPQTGYDTVSNFSRYKITTFTGSCSMQINQTSAGIMWKAMDGFSNSSYTVNGQLNVGATTVIKGNLSISNATVRFRSLECWRNVLQSPALYVRTLGRLWIDQSSIFFDDTANSSFCMQDSSNYPIYINNSWLGSKNNCYYSPSVSVQTFFNHVIIDKMTFQTGIVTLNDVSFLGHNKSVYALYSTGVTATGPVSFDGFFYPVKLNAINTLISGATITNCPYLVDIFSYGKNSSYLDCSSTSLLIYPGSTWTSSKAQFNRSETLNISLVNNTVPYVGGYVECDNVSGTVLWNVSTGGTGFITPKIVEVERWQGNNNPMWRVPLKLKITAGNFHSTMSLNLSNFGVGGCHLVIPVFNNWTAGLLTREHIINATGTHDSRYNSTTHTWMAWANYTGSTTAVTLHANPLYASGTLTKILRGVGGWDVYANYTSDIGTTEHITNATGTHQYRWNSSSNKWWVWANYTGVTTPVSLHSNIGNAFGTLTDVLRGAGGWDVYANYTSSLLSRQNLNAYLSGTHQSRWNSTTGIWMSWANYTGADLLSRQTIVNASGTHQSRYNSTTNHWMSWANYTGSTTAVTLHANPLYASGTLTDTLRGVGGWDVYANYTSALGDSSNIVGATGTHQHRWNSSTNTWWDWANYTGAPAPTLTLRENLNSYLSGTHQSRLNSSTNILMVWANYSGANLMARYNKLNAYQSGTIQTRYNSSTNNWMSWANVTGADLLSRQTIGYATGTHQSRYNSTTNHWMSWANYSSALGNSQTITNALGVHQSRWNATKGTWWDWANYSTTEILRTKIGTYLSGTLQGRYNATTGIWMAWANYSGANLMARYNKLNAYQSGTIQTRYNSSTNNWMSWANVTGAPLISRQTIVNATGTHDSRYNATSNNWMSWANYTGTGGGSLNFIEHLINATGTHQQRWTGASWTIWNNYTGNTTALHQLQNIVNAIGTHTYLLNSTGYWDWANYTGDPAPTLKLRENLNSYLTGTHQSRLNSSTNILMVWANYSGANLIARYNPLNIYQSGTIQTRYNSSTNNWMSWANVTGASLVSREKITNALGTHASRYNATTNKWMSWANYTGNGSGVSSVPWLTVINPNPGNGTHGTNYLNNRTTGLSTSLDVQFKNFSSDENIFHVYAGGDLATTGRLSPVSDYWKTTLTVNKNSSVTNGIRSIDLDNNYVYSGGVDWRVYQFWRSNMTKKAQTALYGGTINVVRQNGNYVYAGGYTTNKVYQYWKSNLTKKAQTADTDNLIFAMAVDDTYVYSSGYGTYKVNQYWLSNLTKRAESSSYGNSVYSLEADNTYVYAGGLGVNKVYQYWRSNMTKKAETASYGGSIMCIKNDSTYLYVGGSTTNKVYQYWKSNLTKKAETSSVSQVASITQDTYYVYASQNGYIYKYNKFDMSLNKISTRYGTFVDALNSIVTTDGDASAGRFVNITWYSNSSGSWLPYATTIAYSNGTYTVPALNFSGIGTYYWKAVCVSNNHTWYNTSVFRFTTYVYTSPPTAITLYQHPVNATGTHTYTLTPTGYKVYANYTGTTTPVNLHSNIGNASGTLTKTLRGVGGWDVYANYTSHLNTYPSCIGGHGNIYYYWLGFGLNYWVVYDDFKSNDVIAIKNPNPGNTTNLGYNYLKPNASGINTSIDLSNYYFDLYGDTVTLDFSSNSSGIWLPYGSIITTVNGTYGIINTNMTSSFTKYWWKVNCTGGYEPMISKTFWFETGNLSGIAPTLFENITNASGSHIAVWTGTNWDVYANYTGNTTDVTLHANPLYASGTLTKTLRGIGGWDVYANYTSDIGTTENITNATGTHQYRWNGSSNKWWVWANYTGTGGGGPTPIHLRENIINATGTHTYLLNGSGYWVDANYTGNTTPVFLFQNFINATGIHVKHLGPLGWNVWANVTGNTSLSNTTMYIPVSNGYGMMSNILVVGMIAGYPSILLTKRRRKKKQY